MDSQKSESLTSLFMSDELDIYALTIVSAGNNVALYVHIFLHDINTNLQYQQQHIHLFAMEIAAAFLDACIDSI